MIPALETRTAPGPRFPDLGGLLELALDVVVGLVAIVVVPDRSLRLP